MVEIYISITLSSTPERVSAVLRQQHLQSNVRPGAVGAMATYHPPSGPAGLAQYAADVDTVGHQRALQS